MRNNINDKTSWSSRKMKDKSKERQEAYSQHKTTKDQEILENTKNTFLQPKKLIWHTISQQ